MPLFFVCPFQLIEVNYAVNPRNKFYKFCP